MNTQLQDLGDWVDEVAGLTQPDQIHWCTGTPAEYDTFVQEMLASGALLALNQEHYPD